MFRFSVVISSALLLDVLLFSALLNWWCSSDSKLRVCCVQVRVNNYTWTLSWSPPLFNGGSPVLTYDILTNCPLPPPPLPFSPSLYQYFASTVDNSTRGTYTLQPGNTCAFEVAACNAIGCGASSLPSATVTTQNSTPLFLSLCFYVVVRCLCCCVIFVALLSWAVLFCGLAVSPMQALLMCFVLRFLHNSRTLFLLCFSRCCLRSCS